MEEKKNYPTDPFKNIIYGSLSLEQKFIFSGNMEYPFNVEAIGITRPDKDYFIARNRSDYIVIEYVVSGKGTLTVNGNDFVLEAGDVYILPAESTHSYRADENDPYRKLWCNFYSDTFEKIMADYRLNGRYVFHAPECEEDFVRLVELATFGSRLNDNEWAHVAGVLMGVLNKIAAHEYRPAGSRATAARAKELLDGGLFSNLTVEDVTKQLFVSKTILTREFRSMYGTSPYRYYLDKKLSQAKLMLHNSNLSVKEISDKLCFSDEHYFSGLFKRKVGVSPSDFRKMLR